MLPFAFKKPLFQSDKAGQICLHSEKGQNRYVHTCIRFLVVFSIPSIIYTRYLPAPPIPLKKNFFHNPYPPMISFFFNPSSPTSLQTFFPTHPPPPPLHYFRGVFLLNPKRNPERRRVDWEIRYQKPRSTRFPIIACRSN